MVLQDEERPPRSYDWSGKRSRRQRLTRIAMLGGMACAVLGVLLAGDYVRLPFLY